LRDDGQAQRSKTPANGPPHEGRRGRVLFGMRGEIPCRIFPHRSILAHRGRRRLSKTTMRNDNRYGGLFVFYGYSLRGRGVFDDCCGPRAIGAVMCATWRGGKLRLCEGGHRCERFHQGRRESGSSGTSVRPSSVPAGGVSARCRGYRNCVTGAGIVCFCRPSPRGPNAMQTAGCRARSSIFRWDTSTLAAGRGESKYGHGMEPNYAICAGPAQANGSPPRKFCSRAGGVLIWVEHDKA